jgi:predicted restriction endonuclease
MMSGTDILKLEGGTYMVDYDAKVEYGDRFIWLHKDTKEFYNVIYPSQVSSYNKVKVTWYYEDEGVDNTVVWTDPEDEINQLPTAELSAAIDQDIINMLRGNLNNDFTPF